MKATLASRLIFALAFLFPATHAFAQCSPGPLTGGLPLIGVDWVKIHWTTDSDPIPGGVDPTLTAANRWNACGSDGIPWVTQGSVGGAGIFLVSATFINGINLQNRCGLYEVGNHHLTLWHHAKDPGTNVTRDCAATPEKLIQNFVHEIGHALDLADATASCGSYAMGKFDPNVSRSVQTSECDKVDEIDMTTEEKPPGTPIVINLEIGPYRLSGPDAPVSFDLDADGLLEQTTWTAQGENDAFLWLDRNANGLVNNGG
ncbi:MAG: hypothetical protein ACRDHN_03100, partial [Thermomicrobiales bacterium]